MSRVDSYLVWYDTDKRICHIKYDKTFSSQAKLSAYLENQRVIGLITRCADRYYGPDVPSVGQVLENFSDAIAVFDEICIPNKCFISDKEAKPLIRLYGEIMKK